MHVTHLFKLILISLFKPAGMGREILICTLLPLLAPKQYMFKYYSCTKARTEHSFSSGRDAEMVTKALCA